MGVNFGKIRFEAIVDALSDTTIWEFKCVEEITPEHRLQLLIYAWLWKMTHTQETKIFKLMNIRTGEVQTLDAYSSLLDDIILLIIRAKFQKLIVKSDEAFIENCKQLISHSSDEVEDSETDDDDPNDSDYVYEGTDDEDDLEFMHF